MNIVKTKLFRVALGALGAIALLVGVLGSRTLLSTRDQAQAAALVSTFSCSESSTTVDGTISMAVGDVKRIFLLANTTTATTDGIDMELVYDPTEFTIVTSTGATVTSVTTSNTFTSLGTYSTNSVTSGAGCNTGLSCIRLNWGATGSGYDTASAADIYGSFYIKALKALSPTTTNIYFDFDGANTGFTTDTDIISQGTSEDTLASVANCTVTVAASGAANDLDVTKTASKDVVSYDGDSDTDLSYTVTIENNDTVKALIATTDDIIDAISAAISDISSSDLDSIKASVADSIRVTSSTTSVTVDDESDLDDGDLNISNITVDPSTTVTVTYDVTIPDGLDGSDFGIDDDMFYGDSVDSGDVTSSNNSFKSGSEAKSDPDSKFVSLGKDGSICVSFDSDVVIVDGSGDDVFVFENDKNAGDADKADEAYDVAFSADDDCSSEEDADNTEEQNSAGFDLGDTNLDYARSILITDSGSEWASTAPGADIDAVGILNIGTLVTNTFKVDTKTFQDDVTTALDLSDLIESPVDKNYDGGDDTNGVDACLIRYGFDPTKATDRSGDRDGDGLSNELECTIGTDPTDPDTDGDGMPDGWEYNHQLLPLDPSDAPLDPDGDGCSNYKEYLQGTDPHNRDTDGDGKTDCNDPHPLVPDIDPLPVLPQTGPEPFVVLGLIAVLAASVSKPLFLKMFSKK